MGLFKNIIWKMYCENCPIVECNEQTIQKLSNDCNFLKSEVAALRVYDKLPEYQHDITYIENRESTVYIITKQLKHNKHSGKIEKMDYFGYLLGHKQSFIQLNGKMIYDPDGDMEKAEIIDIKCEEMMRDLKYGSTMLCVFIENAKKLNVPTVTGWISPQDADTPEKKEMLYHFYGKHGFVITETPEKPVATITLLLREKHTGYR